jgi:hypothetical protein
MNPSGPSIQQIQNSVRATWMAGELRVISRPRSRSGILLSGCQRRPRLSRRPGCHLDPRRLPARHGHPERDRIGALSPLIAKLAAALSIDDRQLYDVSAATSRRSVKREQSEPPHSWQGLWSSNRRCVSRAQFLNNMEGEP